MAVVLLVIVALGTRARPSDPTVSALSVTITDAGTAGATDCSAGRYSSTILDGTRVTLTGDGAVLGTEVITGAGRATEHGCAWTVTFATADAAGEHTLELVAPGPGARRHTYHYDAADLAARDWVLRISVVG